MSELIAKACSFAIDAHRGQKRKYTGETYAAHPARVSRLIMDAPGCTEEMIAAAWLHDTVEDTSVTIEQIKENFGAKVAELVWMLTDISRPEDGNRAQRKAIDRKHIANASAEAQTIKLADLIDNTESIVQHDIGFAKIYISEKIKLLGELLKGDDALWERAFKQAMNAMRTIRESEGA